MKRIVYTIIFGCIFGLICGYVYVTLYQANGMALPYISPLQVERPHIVGFFPYWLISKMDKQYERFVTTYTYFGLAISGDGSLLTHTNPQELEPGWNALQTGIVSSVLNDTKKHNQKRSLLVISGDDVVITQLLENPAQSAKTMMADISPIMKEFGFTDLNLDIETFMEASPSSQAAFTEFVRVVKQELDRQTLGTLSIDLIPISLVRPKLYDAKALGEIADSVILMTYDYHYSGSYTSGAVAPIGGAGETMEFDVETAVLS